MTKPDDQIHIEPRRSVLKPREGRLRLRLVQDVVGLNAQQQPALADLVGRRESLVDVFAYRAAAESEITRAREHIANTPSAGLTVLAFERGLDDSRERLRALRNDQLLIGGLNVVQEPGRARNVTLVASGGQVTELHKWSLSSEDQRHGVERGKAVTLFLPGEGDAESVRWAVLNCHEYTHVDLLDTLLAHRVELLIVVTTHAASRLYWEYATADVHRLFCYVVVANVAEIGGSGVFAPFRRVGRENNAQIGAAGQVFGARGPARLSVEIDLEIGELRRLREEFTEFGFEAKVEREAHLMAGEDASRAKYSLHVEPVVPPEHYLHSFDRPAGPPPVTTVRDVPHSFTASSLRVAIAQLDDMGFDAYADNRYRLRNHAEVPTFIARMEAQLGELELRCKSRGKAESGSLLDMLVLPEVFVPRDFLPNLQSFSDRLGCTVIAGLDYPGEEEADNANECQILRPNEEPVPYRKITRSQYDARGREKRMSMQRGSELVRFVDGQGRGFGVLICYDFSHGDLVHRINLSARDEPLEFMVIIAHNPFGNLYRSCCVADSHRYYQYVVMCNVSKYGGSGVFGPLRTAGARQTLLDVGKGAEALAIAELDLGRLRLARAGTDEMLNQTGQANPLRSFMRRPGIFQVRVG